MLEVGALSSVQRSWLAQVALLMHLAQSSQKGKLEVLLSSLAMELHHKDLSKT